MRVIHKGIRPVGELTKDENIYRPTWYEKLEGGGYRIWNNKLLKSGCGKSIDGEEENGLIYCPYCNEWASVEQYERE